jgi:ATP-binding protein involved in chromosome partitioning
MSLEAEVKQKVGSISDPEIGRSLADLNMVKSVTVDGSAATVTITLPTHAYPGRERLESAVKEATTGTDVNVVFEHNVKGKNTGGSIGLNVKNIIAVGSGKGGVGKSTVAACLASGLHSMGAKVGLMDADVYGPSIPHMMNADEKPAAKDKEGANGQKITRIEPVEVNGIKLMSMGFFTEPGQAVVWRGPMLHKALTQFLRDTDWGELDYLIIDLPPGTGDVSLTLAQLVGLAGAVIVCTPQQVALLDAVKAIDMYNKVNVPVLGIVENMAGEVFGRGGAKAKAEELGVPFLGEIPIEATIRVKGDDGQIPALFTDDHPAKEALLNVCQTTAMQVARQLLETPQMPTLEIL